MGLATRDGWTQTAPTASYRPVQRRESHQGPEAVPPDKRDELFRRNRQCAEGTKVIS